MTGPPLIQLSGASARRGGRAVLANLELEISPGEVVVVTGANGCGKTTLLRVIAGLDPTSTGTLHRRLGTTSFVPDRPRPPDLFTPSQYADHLARMMGRPRPRRIVDELAEEMALVPGPDQPFVSFSRGNLHKAVLIAVLASPGDLVVLDEPTANLDTAARQSLAGLVGRLAQRGSAVIASAPSADGALSGDVVTRVVGLAEGSLTAAPASLQHCRVILRPARTGGAPDSLPLRATRRDHDGTVHLTVHEADLDALLVCAVHTGWSVVEVARQGGGW